ncbi:hypothetical protein LTR37_020537 [Vermiconidia calcicola]|uniref:Uncharacterized protein n=1 Tax=Vermiconidia calcicola TaxID=1690605 RepID=A0ACC3MCT1_9PEZI|nr:hypothetical protein LTR37_020537 [Vermiconidia calcicola]
MDTTKSPFGSVKRQSRNVSIQRPQVERRATRGPLDVVDDPLADASIGSAVASPTDPASARQSAELQAQPSEPEPEARERPTTDVDLSFLKDPSIYHQLGTEDIPRAFLDSPNQPPSDTPLAELLQYGHFRRAAGASLIELTRCTSDDATSIFELLYTRLACLVLISRADLASVEAASMTDFLACNAPGAEKLTPLIPWELRILLVRLQSIAAADGGRRGIMALYALSAEVRAHIHEAQEAGNEHEVSLWSDRLRDLGLRVADTFVEMGELETATRHLDSLVDPDIDELVYRKALLRLRIGDVAGARRCVERIQNAQRRDDLDTLLEAANGHMSKAAEEWQIRTNEHAEDALSATNLAVGLLYTGKIAQARRVFEELSQRSPAFPGLLFNLGTVYELCTEHALERKNELAQTIAAKAPSSTSGGWERANFDFKL